jgi:hypothetical protein
MDLNVLAMGSRKVWDLEIIHDGDEGERKRLLGCVEVTMGVSYGLLSAVVFAVLGGYGVHMRVVDNSAEFSTRGLGYDADVCVCREVVDNWEGRRVTVGKRCFSALKLEEKRDNSIYVLCRHHNTTQSNAPST